MTEINQTSQQSLQRILDKLGVKSSQDKKVTENKSTLGQEDFLKLMTTQLQNQDPFAPMENGDFIAQMAQFSTVTGITEMGNEMKALNDKLDSFRIATASQYLGHSVLVPGNVVRANENSNIEGVIDVPNATTKLQVFFQRENGEILEQLDLGSQSRGLVGFSWKNIPQEVLEQNEYITVEAFADQGEGLEGVSTSVFGEVLAASTSASDGVMLDVKGYGDINVNEVVRFRQNSGS